MLPANNLPKHARHHVGLILALAGLVSAATLVPGPARLASAQAVAPSSSFPGNLNTAREGHTATLLPNGNAAGATRSSTEPNAARPRPEPPEALFLPDCFCCAGKCACSVARFIPTTTQLKDKGAS